VQKKTAAAAVASGQQEAAAAALSHSNAARDSPELVEVPRELTPQLEGE